MSVQQIINTEMDTLAFGQDIERLTEKLKTAWWQSPLEMPEFRTRYSTQQQAANEKQLDRLTDGLIAAVKRSAHSKAEGEQMREKVRNAAFDFARQCLGFEEQDIDLLETSGLIDASVDFAHQARRDDPRVSDADIYQAGRNVMSMNFLQLLMGLPVKVTPSIFAYSMLYPYTDNYLDNPDVPLQTKMTFNKRFYRRLAGELISPVNAYETRIFELVDLVENEFHRNRYPQVYESLLAIHTAQAKSLLMARNKKPAPYEVDVLSIDFEKGGAAVLADGYLITGTVTPEQAEFMFAYGVFTQLMDDLEDVPSDLKDGISTPFSQAAVGWKLDALTNRTFHLGRWMLERLDVFTVPRAGALKAFFVKCLDPLLIYSAGKLKPYYSAGYLKELESYLPFRYDFLAKQEKKLQRSRILTVDLVDLL